LHNHFFYDEPRVFFMHVSAEGSLERLSDGVRAGFDRIGAIRREHPTLSGVPTANLPGSSITADPIEEIIGVRGQSKDGMFKVVLGRETKMSCGCPVGKEMGINTWAAFAGSDSDAVVDGDFVTFEGELQPVLRA